MRGHENPNTASCKALTKSVKAKRSGRPHHSRQYRALLQLYWHANFRVYLTLILCLSTAILMSLFALRTGQLMLNGAAGLRNADTVLASLTAFFTGTCLVLYKRERRSLDGIEQRMAEKINSERRFKH